MKKALLIAALVLIGSGLFAQPDQKAPYEKFSGFPPINLLLPDSSTYFTKADLKKNKAVLLVLFSPMCEHCQHETEEIIKNIDKFNDVQILLVTSLPFDSMLTFRQKYDLEKYSNIVVAHDPHFFLIPYFQIHNMPFLAFYDKKKQFISVHEGTMPIEQVIEEINK